jgi:polyhydroxybutyrate depolymerase
MPIGRTFTSALASVVALMSVVCMVGCGEPADVEASAFAYPTGHAAACQSIARPGPAGELRRLDGGTRYRVRTPTNYDSSYPHPLLVVLSAAGANASRTERYTHFTPAATQQGFVVAYVDHHVMSVQAITDLGRVVRDVAGRWCIDRERVFVAGHSDGGTAATALALLPETRVEVRGIAVSAAGFRTEDLRQLGCRGPIPAMVTHGANDQLFPGWGEQAAKWWAACNGCKPLSQPVQGRPECQAYEQCPKSAPVLFCELPIAHETWPDLQALMIGFLLRPETAAIAHGTD